MKYVKNISFVNQQYARTTKYYNCIVAFISFLREAIRFILLHFRIRRNCIVPLNYFGISRSIIYLVVHTIALLGVKFKMIYRESLNGRRQCTGKKGRGPR